MPSQSPGASLSREGVPGHEKEDSATVTAKCDALVQFYFLISISDMCSWAPALLDKMSPLCGSAG